MMIEFVKHPVFTEKSVRLIADNQYTFDVDLKLTKPEIKKVIKDIFKVDVLSINTHIPPRKKKRLGMTTGFKSSKKRVIITIKAGQSLPLLTDN
uniref:ribosomal protein L23 n=1 Tax=Polulichloris maxima TaxID=2704661 RepID=UPI002410EF78|nr:ribosomal protein L23 [Polulichloris maxima]WDY13228.1 ribosomal protein L23 [Polulichloris maxima]